MKRLLLLIFLSVTVACNNVKTTPEGDCPIYPDYVGVTIPVNIAPLDFDYVNASDKNIETEFIAGDYSCKFKGTSIRWSKARWTRLIENAAGGEIDVTSSAANPWKIYVSKDSIDYGICYRLLEPGYETYSKMGIYERNLGNYRQTTLIDNNDFSGCLNCHSFRECDPGDLSMHIRGEHGATILRLGSEMGAYNTKTEESGGFCVYPYWHPKGRYIAYSTNSTRQLFNVQPDKLIEVFDMASDVRIYDTEKNLLFTAPQVSTKDKWETFPSFSPDGDELYLCRADSTAIPDSLSKIRYNLCRVSFNPETGEIGQDVEVLVNAADLGKSVSFPKPSYDGKFIVYTLSDYGQFSIWHHEADLWILDLATGETRPLDGANSDDTESYHSWSSNSRWLVVSSRRDDGLFTRPYFVHIDENGREGKAFMLPQKSPSDYYGSLYFSYNVPEFVKGPVKFDYRKARKLLDKKDRIQFGSQPDAAPAEEKATEVPQNELHGVN